VLKEQQGRASRYDAVIATLVGVSALFVSAYTAHVQRQQVRAAVWPILEYSTSNEPMICLTLDNKGVGPAIIRNVKVTVDGQPVRNWPEVLQKLEGPGHHKLSESNMGGHVLSAAESMKILVPHDDDNGPLTGDKPGPLRTAMDEGRRRIGVEICYCSTLGECWTLRGGPNNDNATVETSTCPGPSATTFEQ
jgi:hypothetical protein